MDYCATIWSRIRLRKLVSARRYVYHLLSVDALSKVIGSGGVLKPRSMGVDNPLANRELVRQRTMCVLDEGCMLHETIPFYLSPRQPMFCRLVRMGVLRSSDIVALGFDFEKLRQNVGAPYWFFDSNPVYEGTRRLMSWENRHSLDWAILCAWRWNNDKESRDSKLAKSAIRQAEIDVKGCVPLTAADHMVVDVGYKESFHGLLCKRIKIRNLHIW